MGADFSRVRLNSLLDFAGVELKQGGVVLDADANELMGIVDRRLRALASDTLGRATVSSTTPDAFEISVAGGTLQIGKGRLYVDGLLAENHGAESDDAAKRAFDDLMAELVFTDGVAYTAQPYFPSPPALPTAGRHLVYLDVWNREVTHLESPDLVETAVGVETSSRLQTVWQVRVLDEEAGANTDCESPDADLASWSAHIAPSTGVLSTGTFEVALVDDPCELPNTGGYRGLENQLYRVEIHNEGQPGAGATFKWSRENASVGSVVASVISSKELELPSLGRDDVLRFNTGDWVEITDNVRELSQAPGEVRRITVSEATHRITFADALPTEMLPGSFPNSTFPVERHMRVRRWDQKGKVFRKGSGGTTVQVQDLDAVSSTGLIAVPAAGTELLLENGVTVSFDSIGTKGFRAGDYWVFAARTTDASVEPLHRAPPRGIHHHYARLGLWDIAAGSVTDCRNPWPPGGGGNDCSCSACVTQESHASGHFTIQDAVDQVREAGGTVCLGVGTYALETPVRLVSARAVRVRGQGLATVIVSPAGAFALENCIGAAIENVTILSVGGAAAITVQNALGISLRQLIVGMFATRDAQPVAIALSGVVAAASIRENAILAAVGVAAAGTAGAEPVGTTTRPPAFLATAAVAIDDNIFWCQRHGVALVGNVLHIMGTRITGNEFVSCRDAGVSTLGMGAPGSSMAIRDNVLSVTGDGIRSGVDGARIADNKIVNTATGAAARGATTVGIALVAGLDKDGPDQCQILANQVSGFRAAGIRIGTPTRELLVKLNIIESCGSGIVSTDDANGGAVSIENNHLRDIDSADDDPGASVIGIGLRRAKTASIGGNTIRSVGVTATRSPLRAAILTVGVSRARVFANEVTDVAPPGDFIGVAAGIMIRAPFLQFEVTNNHVQRDSAPSTQVSNGTWHALLAADTDPKVPVNRAGALTSVLIDGERLLTLGGGRMFMAAASVLADTSAESAAATAPAAGTRPGAAATLAAAAPAAVFVGVRAGALAADAALADITAVAIDPVVAAAAQPELARGAVIGNVLMARGPAAAVQLAAAGECLFNDNRVESRLGPRIAVNVATQAAIISSNRVRGGVISINVAAASRFAVLGNITTGAIVVPGGLQPPWNALNLLG